MALVFHHTGFQQIRGAEKSLDWVTNPGEIVIKGGVGVGGDMSEAGAKVFISYKRGHAATEELLRQLEVQLIERGYDVLLDERLQGGDRWPPHLYEWLLGCAAAVVIASPEARASDWCQREWHVLAARAETGGARVIPICIGVDRAELGPLSNIQSLAAGPNVVTEVMAALKDVVPWRVSSEDYLALHRAWNRYQFEREAVLGREPFALEGIYVDTECGVLPWHEISAGRKVALDPFKEKNGGRVSLLAAVMRFVTDAKFRDAVVVQGPAGAGKSAFTLRFASDVESRGLHAVRLRFRDMRLSTFNRVEQMLADAVRIGPESEERPVPEQELFDEARLRETASVDGTTLCKWVFILDGWDEVSLAGSAGYQAQLRTWLPKIREFFKRSGPQVRVIITGRPSAELKESGFLFDDTPVLTLRPIRPDQLAWLAQQLGAEAYWGDLSRCSGILSKYRQWFEQRDDRSVEMLGLPLLALLTFRTLSRWEGNVEQLISSPSALYSALIDQTVAHSGKGVSEELHGTVQRGGAGLRHLLRRTAALISIFWTERISFEELQARMEECNDLEEWVSSATEGHPLYELVVNFYFKGGHPDLGCEFLHKSFREYLFAEAIVEELLRVTEGEEGPLAPPPPPYWKDFDPDTIWYRASRALGRLLAPCALTPEVRRHLFWLIERAIADQPQRWVLVRDLLADVYAWWAEGVHLRLQPIRERGQLSWKPPYVFELAQWALPYKDANAEPQRTATIDGYLGYALMQLTAWVHSQLRETKQTTGFQRPYQRSLPSRCVRFCPGNNYFRNILARWEAVLMPFETSYVLPDVWLEGEHLAGILLPQADLTRANLKRVNLRGASLATAFLEDVDLSYGVLDSAILTHAVLIRTHLEGARLTNADMSHAMINGSDLSRAYLSNADLSHADVHSSKFTAAKLLRSDLSHAGIFNTDFSNASLKDAALSYTTLQDVNFTDTRLHRVNLRHATLSRVNFSGAIVRGINLSHVKAEETTLPPATQMPP